MKKVGDYILDLVLATRKPSAYGIAIDHQIEYGASPRATLYLNMVARANALLHGRGMPRRRTSRKSRTTYSGTASC